MQPRPSASLGCFGTLSVIGILFASYAFLRLITKVPPRAYSLLEIWVAVATFGIPIIYVLMLVVGRIRLNTALGGTNPTESSAFMLGRLRESRSEQIYALALALFVLSSASGIGWSLFNHFLTSITPVDLNWWAILATTGILLVAGLGYTLGATPMEDQRRVGLACFVGFFFLFSVPYSLYLWAYSRSLPMSFWASIPISVICIVLTWRYLATGWEPATLSWNDTWIERHSTSYTLPGIGIAGLAIFGLIIGGRGWLLGGLLPWLLFVISYVCIQGWRHRPR